MAKKIFKAVNVLDWLIAAAALYIIANMDFANLTTVNIIYLVTFVIWLVLFALRIVIVVRRADL